eukprot:7455520-Alexandrium_andersonii.AAC.1
MCARRRWLDSLCGAVACLASAERRGGGLLRLWGVAAARRAPLRGWRLALAGGLAAVSLAR